MDISLSAAEVGKIVSALQKNCPEDYEAYKLATDLIGSVKREFYDLPFADLFEDWLKEWDISTTLIPSLELIDK